jgi:hypothetical protein
MAAMRLPWASLAGSEHATSTSSTGPASRLHRQHQPTPAIVAPGHGRRPTGWRDPPPAQGWPTRQTALAALWWMRMPPAAWPPPTPRPAALIGSPTAAGARARGWSAVRVSSECLPACSAALPSSPAGRQLAGMPAGPWARTATKGCRPHPCTNLLVQLCVLAQAKLPRHAHCRVQLIHIAQGSKVGRVLGQPLAVVQRGRPTVACLGVDLVPVGGRGRQGRWAQSERGAGIDRMEPQKKSAPPQQTDRASLAVGAHMGMHGCATEMQHRMQRLRSQQAGLLCCCCRGLRRSHCPSCKACADTTSSYDAGKSPLHPTHGAI